MRKGNVFTLDGSTTEIWYAEGPRDLDDFLGSFHDETFWIFDEKVLGMFPKYERPFSSFVASWENTQHDMDHVMELILQARRLHLGRDSRWVVIGGSTVTRIASLASLLFCGGTKLTLVPTTLLAMNDSAICGRCGISYPGDRNLCSTVHRPDEIFIDLRFISFADAISLKNGGSEIIKSAVLRGDSGLMDILSEKRNPIRKLEPSATLEAIETAIDTKVGLIMDGRTRELEFGHRFAYGFMDENIYGKKHGPAIAWGMARAAAMGVSLGITDPLYAGRLTDLIVSYGYDVNWRFPKNATICYQHAPFFDPYLGSVEMLVPEHQGKLLSVRLPFEKMQKYLCS